MVSKTVYYTRGLQRRTSERSITEYIGIGYDLAEIFKEIINIDGKPIRNEYHGIQIFLECFFDQI